VDTHNLNHGLRDQVMDVLDFEHEQGYLLSNRYTCRDNIGSPPCINFSMSNRAGKADKSSSSFDRGFLRVIAVKSTNQAQF